MKVIGWMFIVLVAIVVSLAFLALEAWVLQVLWNWVVVGLFKLPALSFGYSVGIVLLLSFVGTFLKIKTK